jgi:hypothetical protein
MDLNTITEVLRPTSADAVTTWENDFAWLAGGTWLFSEPQIHIHTLIDLETLKWPSLQALKDGLEIATCKIATISRRKRRGLDVACFFLGTLSLFLRLSKFGMKPRWKRKHSYKAPSRARLDLAHAALRRLLRGPGGKPREDTHNSLSRQPCHDCARELEIICQQPR